MARKRTCVGIELCAAEQRRIDGGDHDEAIGRNFHAIRNEEIEAADPPMIGGMIDVIKLDRAGRMRFRSSMNSFVAGAWVDNGFR